MTTTEQELRQLLQPVFNTIVGNPRYAKVKKEVSFLLNRALCELLHIVNALHNPRANPRTKAIKECFSPLLWLSQWLKRNNTLLNQGTLTNDGRQKGSMDSQAAQVLALKVFEAAKDRLISKAQVAVPAANCGAGILEIDTSSANSSSSSTNNSVDSKDNNRMSQDSFGTSLIGMVTGSPPRSEAGAQSASDARLACRLAKASTWSDNTEAYLLKEDVARVMVDMPEARVLLPCVSTIPISNRSSSTSSSSSMYTSPSAHLLSSSPNSQHHMSTSSHDPAFATSLTATTVTSSISPSYTDISSHPPSNLFKVIFSSVCPSFPPAITLNELAHCIELLLIHQSTATSSSSSSSTSSSQPLVSNHIATEMECGVPTDQLAQINKQYPITHTTTTTTAPPLSPSTSPMSGESTETRLPATSAIDELNDTNGISHDDVVYGES